MGPGKSLHTRWPIQHPQVLVLTHPLQGPVLVAGPVGHLVEEELVHPGLPVDPFSLHHPFVHSSVAEFQYSEWSARQQKSLSVIIEFLKKKKIYEFLGYNSEKGFLQFLHTFQVQEVEFQNIKLSLSVPFSTELLVANECSLRYYLVLLATNSSSTPGMDMEAAAAQILR